MTIEELISNYTSWIKEQTSFRKIDDWYEINTPFLNHNNDVIQIYAKRVNGSVQLSDGGDTLNELSLSGVTFERSPKRKKEFQTILNGFGIERQGTELVALATEDSFAEVKHRLVQAIMSVDDMFLLANPKVESFFLEDVTNYFDEHNIRYTPDVAFFGKSGFPHNFEFSIARSKKQAERLVKLVNTPRTDTVSSILWAYEDTSARRPNSEGIVIMNDNNRKVDPGISEALDKYGLKGMKWSQKDQYLDYLAA